MQKYILTVIGTFICSSLIFLFLWAYAPLEHERKLIAVEEVRKQYIDDDGNNLGEVQTFTRKIYKRKLVLADNKK